MYTFFLQGLDGKQAIFFFDDHEFGVSSDEDDDEDFISTNHTFQGLFILEFLFIKGLLSHIRVFRSQSLVSGIFINA